MLPVPITADDITVTMGVGISKPSLNGAADSQITGEIKNEDPRFTGYCGRSVKGAIIDDKDVRKRCCPTDFSDEVGKSRMFVKSRNNN